MSTKVTGLRGDFVEGITKSLIEYKEALNNRDLNLRDFNIHADVEEIISMELFLHSYDRGNDIEEMSEVLKFVTYNKSDLFGVKKWDVETDGKEFDLYIKGYPMYEEDN